MPGPVLTSADDFGWDRESVEATIEGLEAGWLRNASIMANTEATDLALAYAASHPQHGWGVHLTLTRDADESPVLPRAQVSRLVDAEGRFHTGRDAQIRAGLGLFPADQIAAEFAAQINRVVDAGVEVSYVDSHKHLHKYPGVARVLGQLLPEYGIERVRTAQDRFETGRRGRPSAVLAGPFGRRLARRWITTDHFFMPDGADRSDWWTKVPLDLPGSLEVGFHPGAELWRANEARGGAELGRLLAERGITPLRWSDLDGTDQT